jgi:hypothetical protein
LKHFNNQHGKITTVNYSVPDDVKQRFNKTFAGQNKSAVIASLMQAAVADEELHRRRDEAMGRLLNMRRRAPVSAETIRETGKAGRP